MWIFRVLAEQVLIYGTFGIALFVIAYDLVPNSVAITLFVIGILMAWVMRFTLLGPDSKNKLTDCLDKLVGLP